jgi:hypothetical protein
MIKEPKSIPRPPFKSLTINFLVFGNLVGDAHAFKQAIPQSKPYKRHRHLQEN